MDALASYFKFAERGTNLATEIRAGVTTFMVMAYIIFLNPGIIAEAARPRSGRGRRPATALIAGIMTIAMGVVGELPVRPRRRPRASTRIVAFTLTGARGSTRQGAMGVIVLEGVVITILVVVGLREAIMNAVPLALKRSIGVGIGLFILFIGFVERRAHRRQLRAGLGTLGFCDGTLVTCHSRRPPASSSSCSASAITIVLFVAQGPGRADHQHRRSRRSSRSSSGSPRSRRVRRVTPNFSTLGLGLQDPFQAFTKLGGARGDPDDLRDHAHGLLRHDGHGHRRRRAEAGLADAGRLRAGHRPGPDRRLASPRSPAAFGGVSLEHDATSRARPASPRAAGPGSPRSSPASCSCSRSSSRPLAGIIPSQATAPALVLVGYLMFTLIKDIDVTDVEDGIPALLTIILMPLTYDITVGIGAGLHRWVFIKVVKGKFGEIHPLMWVVSIAFVVYFAQDWIQTGRCPK